MTLTPVPLPVPQAFGYSPLGGTSGSMLQPLVVGKADARPRLLQILRAMSGDLVGRALLDRQLEGRWPGKLVVGVGTTINKVKQRKG